MCRFAVILILFLSSSAIADLAGEVRCREISFSLAAEIRDAELFASFIDLDARFVGSSVTHGPAAIAEAWGAFFADDGPSIKWRPQFVEVLEDGTLALTRGPYRMITTGENGEQTEHWGTFNSVWRRNGDGAWRVVFDAGNTAAEPPGDEVKVLLDQADDC